MIFLEVPSGSVRILTAIFWNYQCLFQEQILIKSPARSSKGYLTLEVFLWMSMLVILDQELTPWLGKNMQQCLRRSKNPACFTCEYVGDIRSRINAMAG